MLLTHTPMHFSFCCCIQFPTKAESPTGMEGLCHEFYSSSNVEQHWAQHIAVYTTTPHIIAELFKNVCHKPSSSYLCWHVERTYIFPGVLHSSFVLRNTSLLCLLVCYFGHFNSTTDQHFERSSSRPLSRMDSLVVWVSKEREWEGMPFRLGFLSIYKISFSKACLVVQTIKF